MESSVDITALILLGIVVLLQVAGRREAKDRHLEGGIGPMARKKFKHWPCVERLNVVNGLAKLPRGYCPCGLGKTAPGVVI